MKNGSFFLALAVEHKYSLYVVAVMLGALCIFLLKRIAKSKRSRISASVAVSIGTVFAAIGLRKWLIALGTVAASYHPRKNFFTYTDHFKDAAISYLTSLDVLPWASCFYGLVGLTTFLSIKFLKNETDSKELRNIGYAFVTLLVVVATIGAALPVVLTAALYYARKPRVTFELLKGKDVIEDDQTKAVSKLKSALGSGERGIRLHSDVRVTKNLETQHLMVIGCTGCGKTNLLAPMVDDIFHRGDKIVLYDVKKDFTAAYVHDKRVLLLSPFDARGRAWNIAKDIRSEIDADELGKTLFPTEQGREQFFALAGQNITKSALLKLIAEKGDQWGFKDLADLFSNKQYIMDAVRQYLPASSQVWGSDGGKQSEGVFGEIRTRLSCFDYFAKAWPNSHLDGISFSEWLGDSSAPNMILVQSNAKHTFVDNFFTSLVYTYLFKQIQSFDDNLERRVWAVIDEFSSLPTIPNFGDTLSKARSKGLCIVLVLQDFGTIDRKYAIQGGRQTIVNNIGTKAVGCLSAPEAAEYISQMIGMNEYLRRTFIPFLKKGEAQPHPVPESKPAVSASTFRDIKLPSEHRPAEFYIVIQGAPVVKLKYKIHPLPKISPAFVEAEWMSETPKSVKPASATPTKKIEGTLNDLKREVGDLAKTLNNSLELER